MRRTTVAITAGALLLLTGCASVSSGTMSRGTPRDAVVTAALTAQQAGTAHVALDVRTLGDDPVALTLDGRVALDGSAADLTASVPRGGLGSASSASVHEIVVDGSTYLQVQGIDLLPAVWVKADLGAGGADVDNPLARLATSAGVDELLAALREVGTVEKVARQEVGGVPTTKYHAALDASGFLRDLPDLGALAGGLDLGAIADAVSVPVDLWIDEQGRLVQLQATVGSGDDGVRVTLGLADLGAPLDVRAPSAALDLGGLLDGLSG